MQRRYHVGLIIAGGIVLVVIATVVIAHNTTRSLGKLVADATLVNVAGQCAPGFDRALALHNTGEQPVQWHAPALTEADITDITSVPASGRLQPQATQVVHIHGHTLRGGFTIIFQWQGAPVSVQFSCNGPM